MGEYAAPYSGSIMDTHSPLRKDSGQPDARSMLHAQSIKIGKLKAYQKTDMCKRRQAAARMRPNQHWYCSKFIKQAEHD